MTTHLFVQGYWGNNLGDDLFLEALCNRYPNVQFTISGKKNFISVFKNIKNLNVIQQKNNFITKLTNKIYSKYGILTPYDKLGFNYDGYVEIGGSIFILPNKENIVDMWLKRRKFIIERNTNYFIIGSNFGPYFFQKQLIEYRNFFSKVTSINFRDLNSYEMFSDMPNVNVAPDVVLNIDDEKYTVIKKNNYVVISVVNLKIKAKSPGSEELISFDKEFEDKLLELTLYYLSHGYDEVVLMSFCESEGDLKTCKNIVNRIREINYRKRVEIFSHRDINKSLNIINGASLIIASRFHAMILGWVFQKPTIVIGYSGKTQQTVDYLNVNQKVLNVEEFIKLSVEEINNFQFLIDINTLKNLRKESEEHFKELDFFIESKMNDLLN